MPMGTGGATLLRVTVPMVHGLASVLQRGLATSKVGGGFIYICTALGRSQTGTYVTQVYVWLLVVTVW